MKISCLGPTGSYSHLVAQSVCDGGEILLKNSFPEAVRALVSGEADNAILPIENSIQGGVLQNLDLLEREEVFAVEERVLKIDHRLALKQGVKLSQIERIYSHEQAIGQCSEYLQANFPNAQLLFAESTAESLEKLDERTAGIVGGHVKREGVVLSEENIANEKNNFTRFLRLVRRGELPKKSEKIFLCAVCKHQPGALLALLKVFADGGVNLTRIESRPIKNVFGEYRFFIELAGNLADEGTDGLLQRVNEQCSWLRLLGAY